MKWFLVLVPIFIYVSASLLANLDLLPKDYMRYWWFDDVGHVVVFGSLALALVHITKKHLGHWWLGAGLTVIIAIADELSQLFLTARSFTVHDLYMSLLGIFIAALLYWVFKKD